MRVSIAMCTYNGAQYLERQLNSFNCQTLRPFELVVCDDGSTDNTLAMLAAFAKEVEFAVRIYTNERTLGSTRNFEKAISLCHGDLIALSDQDDEWYEDKLAEFQRLFEKFSDAVVAFGDADIFDENSALTGESVWKNIHYLPRSGAPQLDAGILSDLFKLNNIATGATMVFRTPFRNEFVPVPESWVHDGWIAWLAAIHGGLAVHPKPMMRYRIHPDQQVGLSSNSLTERLVRAATDDGSKNRTLVTQFQVLRQRLEQDKNNLEFESFLPRVDEKLRFLEGKVMLPPFLFQRAWWILKSWRGYRVYSRGLKSMARDLVSGFRESKEAILGEHEK